MLRDPRNPRWDCLLFFLFIPLLVVMIFLLVQKYPQLIFSLALNYHDPTPLSLIASSYTHVSIGHITINLLGYYVTIFLIFTLRGDRLKFYINMGMIFLVLPVVLSTLSIVYNQNTGYGMGLSVIGAGLKGYLLYSVYDFVKHEWKIPLDKSFVYLVCLFNLLILSLTYHWIGVTVVLSALMFVTGYLCKNGILQILQRIILNYECCKNSHNSKHRNLFQLETFLLILVYLFGISPSLFPANIISAEGVVTGIFAHYIGYIFGIFVPLLIVDKVYFQIRDRH
ncbi:MAG: hypothetical protein U9N13_01390 [Euryarchaeota archaeon]|nr:hypothetical protein [Euryarchaeota archaeon]